MRGKNKLMLNLLPVSEFGLKRVAPLLVHCDGTRARFSGLNFLVDVSSVGLHVARISSLLTRATLCPDPLS